MPPGVLGNTLYFQERFWLCTHATVGWLVGIDVAKLTGPSWTNPSPSYPFSLRNTFHWDKSSWKSAKCFIQRARFALVTPPPPPPRCSIDCFLLSGRSKQMEGFLAPLHLPHNSICSGNCCPLDSSCLWITDGQPWLNPDRQAYYCTAPRDAFLICCDLPTLLAHTSWLSHLWLSACHRQTRIDVTGPTRVILAADGPEPPKLSPSPCPQLFWKKSGQNWKLTF